MAGLGHGKWEMDGSGNDGKHGKFFPEDHEEIVVRCCYHGLPALRTWCVDGFRFQFPIIQVCEDSIWAHQTASCAMLPWKWTLHHFPFTITMDPKPPE
jgi:hypothetical protein